MHWSPKRWPALAGAVLLTVALPIAIDQGYFRYSVYALPLLGLLTVVLYLAFILSSPTFLSFVRAVQFRVGTKHPWFALCLQGAFYLILILGVVGGFVWTLGKSQQHVAELLAKDRAVFVISPTGEAITIVFGGNSATNYWSAIPARGFEPMPGFPIRVYRDGSRVYVDATLRKSYFPRALAAEIKRSQLMFLAPDWDCNLTPQAFEIVDGSHKPVFQLLRDAGSRLVINGILWNDGGQVVVGDDEGLHFEARELSVKTLFKYPSFRNMGVYAQR